MNLSLILFLIGVLGFVLNRKNIILMLISIEIMLLAIIFLILIVSLNFDGILGQIYVTYILITGAISGLDILVVLKESFIIIIFPSFFIFLLIIANYETFTKLYNAYPIAFSIIILDNILVTVYIIATNRYLLGVTYLFVLLCCFFLYLLILDNVNNYKVKLFLIFCFMFMLTLAIVIMIYINISIFINILNIIYKFLYETYILGDNNKQGKAGPSNTGNSSNSGDPGPSGNGPGKRSFWETVMGGNNSGKDSNKNDNETNPVDNWAGVEFEKFESKKTPIIKAIDAYNNATVEEVTEVCDKLEKLLEKTDPRSVPRISLKLVLDNARNSGTYDFSTREELILRGWVGAVYGTKKTYDALTVYHKRSMKWIELNNLGKPY